VDGEFQSTTTNSVTSLTSLSQSLDLANIAVVNVAAMSHGHLPIRPERLSAVMLDEVPEAEAFRWKVEFESLWNVPVIGSLPPVPQLRQKIESLSAQDRPSAELCRALGDALWRRCRVERLLAVAQQQPPLLCRPGPPNCAPSLAPRIAVGLDEAMCRFFPENFELLAAQGAQLLDFSPLRGVVPQHADLLLLSDGYFLAFQERFATHHCLLASLQEHVAQGGCIYAEGMGAAFLGRELHLPSGQILRMAGVVPGSYRLLETPASRQLGRLSGPADNWLTQGCSQLRGYEGCTRLEWLPAENSATVDSPAAPVQLQAWGNVVASTIPLFFPAHPRLVNNLLQASRKRLQIA
jgi:cobyrinic acid a,c-diamide synthase